MSLFPQPAICGASGQGGYFLDRSLRLRSSASAYLSRTFSTPTNNKKWTWSGWVKRGILSTASYSIFGQYTNSTNRSDLYFDANDNLNFYNYVSGSVSPSPQLITTQAFRDPSAWYHIVLVWDSDNATGADRQIIYVNGTRITSYKSSATVASGQSSQINSATGHTIGEFENVNVNFDGYITEINFIDGQALDPTSFGEFDADTGVWKPLSYSGSYGTNGFYLNFNDPTSTATISQDQSGNGNDWTSNNISLTAGATYDSMTDVPTLTGINTANYATLNPLTPTYQTLANGNLDVSSFSGTHSRATGTIFADIESSSGYYFEITPGTNASAHGSLGISKDTNQTIAYNSTQGSLAFASNGVVYLNGSSQGTFSSWANNDVVGIWFSSGNVYYAVNGVAANSGSAVVTGLTGNWAGACWRASSTASPQFNFNFGQRPFTYTPPTGFKSLNTYNLPDSTVDNGSEYMNTVLYTGNGSTQSITGVNFQPDFVWLKSRGGARSHRLWDVIRGATKGLSSNLTNAEYTESGLTSFDSDGFTVGSQSGSNFSSEAFVAWNWKANGSGSSSTTGTIPATVSANTTSGFSIATYTGTGSNGTVQHGLGTTPDMVIIKARSLSSGLGDWIVWHNVLSATERLYLNYNLAKATGQTTTWNSTLPSSTVVSLGNNIHVNYDSSSTYVMYSFAGVEGFSAFGSYTGNASADGPFIYTGFSPSWLLIKRSDAAANWLLYDNKRLGYNTNGYYLLPDGTWVEGTGADNRFDLISNGFKVRDSNQSLNVSGGTYIYAAFAENPFKNSLAR